MKNIWKIIGIIAIVGLCLIVVGRLMGANTGGFYLDQKGFHLYSDQYSLTKVDDIDAISEIKINTASMDIRVMEAEDYGLEMYCREDAMVDYSYENGRLTIEQRGVLGFMTMGLFGWEQEYINLYLPAGVQLDDVDIKNASGEIRIDSLFCKTFFIKQMSGDTEIGRLETNEMTARSSSGKITIKSGKADQFDFHLLSGDLIASGLVSNGLRAELSSGKAKLGGSFAGNTNIKITSGDLQIKIDDAEQDYNRNINMISGDVKINGIKAGEGYVNFNGSNTLDIKMSSGNADIEFLK